MKLAGKMLVDVCEIHIKLLYAVAKSACNVVRVVVKRIRRVCPGCVDALIIVFRLLSDRR